MTKIFEALEQAQKERGETPGELVSVWPQGFPKEDGVEVRPSVVEDFPKHALRQNLEETMTTLFQNIDSMLPDDSGKTIQFIGTDRGEGASVLAREFAKTAALSLNKSVLLLDSRQGRPCHTPYFRVQPKHGWEECVRNETCLADAIYQIGEKRLFVSQLSLRADCDPSVYHLPEMGEFLEDLKQDYDLVIIDSSSATQSPEGLALGRKVDGILLVVEAEKTRRQVAEDVRYQIEDNGGTILGVILNKRRFPIPSFIYNRL